MSLSTMTLVGAFNYMENKNESLFSHLHLPPLIDKDTFIDTMLLNFGDYELLWADPVFVKNMIGVWCNKRYNQLSHMIDSLTKDYNAIENYDRITDMTYKDDNNRVHEGSIGSEQKVTANSNEKINTSAYDSNTYTPSNENVIKDETDNVNRSNSAEVSTESNIHKESGRVHGNIGVTTNQQMIQSEIELRKFSIYDWMCNDLARDIIIFV